MYYFAFLIKLLRGLFYFQSVYFAEYLFAHSLSIDGFGLAMVFLEYSRRRNRFVAKDAGKDTPEKWISLFLKGFKVRAGGANPALYVKFTREGRLALPLWSG
jgi:hypothetical protein